MFRQTALLFAVASALTFARDSTGVIRKQEIMLATALNTHNEASLSAIVDRNFTIHWVDYSFERIVDTSESRDMWFDHVLHMPIGSYDQSITKVQVLNPDQATVTLDDFVRERKAYRKALSNH